jgi:hypothetical protein
MKAFAFIFLFLQLSLEGTELLRFSFMLFLLEMIDILNLFLFLQILMPIVIAQVELVPDILQKIFLVSVQGHYFHLKGQLLLILPRKLTPLLLAPANRLLEVYLRLLLLLLQRLIRLAYAGVLFGGHMDALHLSDFLTLLNFRKGVYLVVLGDCSRCGLVGPQLH